MDTWDSATAYDRFMGRWSGLVAQRFVEWLMPDPGLAWLDVGCGTGSLLAAIDAHAEPGLLCGTEPSPEYAAAARSRLGSKAEVTLGAAGALQYDDGVFDIAVSGLVLNFVTEPLQAIDEVRRVVKPGGEVASYVWDYSAGMEMLRVFWDVAVELDPTAKDLDEGDRFPLCRPDALRDLFGEAGLERPRTTDLTVKTHFGDFDEYWGPFEMAQGPAGAYVASLAAGARNRLRDRLRDTIGSGPLVLGARAWAVRGTNVVEQAIPRVPPAE